MSDTKVYQFGTVSIHAPTWGATNFVHTFPDLLTKFQSTHPRGVRHFRFSIFKSVAIVSIHAPTWGATLVKLGDLDDFQQFQSTHPRGVRRNANNNTKATNQFQSTHPRGVRLYSNKLLIFCLLSDIYCENFIFIYNNTIFCYIIHQYI